MPAPDRTEEPRDGQGRCAAAMGGLGLLLSGAALLVCHRASVRLRHLNQTLLRESRTDGLTQIANRRAWDEALMIEESRRRRHGHAYGLVVVDLDDFKRINDHQGHQRGDQVLRVAASQLAAQLRPTDVLARVGGDEFAILVFNPEATGLDELVSRLQQTLGTAGVRASIGSALSGNGSSLHQAWARADAVMYRMKGCRNGALSDGGAS